MRITICAFDSPGNIDGPTAWLKRLLPYLKENGVTVRIIFIAANSKKLPALNEFKRQGFECKLIAWELFWEEKIIAILKDLRRFRPDVFIPNYFPTACYAARWAKKAGIPSLVILHNDDAMHHALIDEFVYGREEYKVSAIAAVSKFIEEKINTKPIRGVIAEYITYGSPVPAEKTIRQKNEPLKLIYAGRLIEHQKRISELTFALCKAVKNIPGTESIIYGNGTAKKNVLRIISENGKGLPIKYGGVLNSNEVQHHFLQNHVYVLLSDFEGLPISLMEAMACGLVPVCTNLRSGIGEVIEDGHNGFLVNDRDNEFIEAIKKLKDNLVLWQDCSIVARETIIKSFSQDVCNKKWLLLLEKLATLNTNPGKLEIPELEELKKHSVRNEFKIFDNRMLNPWGAFFYRVKKRIGRVKRAILN